jgi:hypothetical protein
MAFVRINRIVETPRWIELHVFLMFLSPFVTSIVTVCPHAN